MRIPSASLLLAALALVGPRTALAQTPSAETRLRDALRSTTAQLRAAEDDRSRLQAAEEQLKRELEAARAQLTAARSAPRPSAREREELSGRLAEAARQLAAQQETNASLTGALARCEAAGGDATRIAEAARSELAAAKERLADAERRNARLYAVGQEIIDWLAEKGFGTALALREPFLGRKRVELENAAQELEDRLREQRLPPPAAVSR